MSETGTRNDPFPAFRYTVRLDDLPPAGFSECTGLQIEFEILDHIEGGLNDHVHKLPTRAKPGSISLTRGIVDRAIWDWCWDATQGRVIRRGGTIAIRPPDGGEPVLAFEFYRAIPSSWSGPPLDAASSQVAVETLELAVPVLERVT
ncbi:MAG: phage tail protein [Pseudomonadota bacterium]